MSSYRSKLERIERIISSIRCEPNFAIINGSECFMHVCKRSIEGVSIEDCESCALCDELTESEIIIIKE